jgi:ArsR family transcriptional regulator
MLGGVTSTDLESIDLESRAASFGALADPIRLRVLELLAGGKRCVCELQKALDIAPNLLSYHLRVLREAGLVVASRRGRWVDYQLEPEVLDRLRGAIPGVDA